MCDRWKGGGSLGAESEGSLEGQKIPGWLEGPWGVIGHCKALGLPFSTQFGKRGPWGASTPSRHQKYSFVLSPGGLASLTVKDLFLNCLKFNPSSRRLLCGQHERRQGYQSCGWPRPVLALGRPPSPPLSLCPLQKVRSTSSSRPRALGRGTMRRS